MQNDDLFAKAAKVADINGHNVDDAYYWLSDHEILILRLADVGNKEWLKTRVADISQFFRFHEGHVFDTARGYERPSTKFNERFSRHLNATPFHMHCVDENGRDTQPKEIKYKSADCSVSSDGKWLVWHNRRGWMAARLDGSDGIRWPENNLLYPGYVFWLRDSHRWASRISEWKGGHYAIQRVVIRRTNDPSYRRDVTIEGLNDGLFVGQTDNDTFIMRHDTHG